MKRQEMDVLEVVYVSSEPGKLMNGLVSDVTGGLKYGDVVRLGVDYQLEHKVFKDDGSLDMHGFMVRSEWERTKRGMAFMAQLKAKGPKGVLGKMKVAFTGKDESKQDIKEA